MGCYTSLYYTHSYSSTHGNLTNKYTSIGMKYAMFFQTKRCSDGAGRHVSQNLVIPQKIPQNGPIFSRKTKGYCNLSGEQPIEVFGAPKRKTNQRWIRVSLKIGVLI